MVTILGGRVQVHLQIHFVESFLKRQAELDPIGLDWALPYRSRGREF